MDELERLRDRVDFHPLIGKRVIGLGGAFSAGKSTFLNLLVGERLLPTGLRPTTAVPTYVLRADEVGVVGLNTFGQSFSMAPEVLKAIEHGRGYDLALGRILRALMVGTARQPYKHLAWLDTPGYSKADGTSTWQDAAVARRQLRAVQAMCWLVEAATGFTDEDLAFLKGLGAEGTLVVVVTKCHKVASADLPGIRANVEASLRRAGLACEGVFLVDRDAPDGHDLPALRTLFAAWDRPAEPNRFVPFQAFFSTYEQHFQAAEQRLNKRLTRLSQLWGGGDEPDGHKLNALLSEAQQELRFLRERREALHQGALQFFTMLGELGAELGLPVPDAEELSTCQDVPRPILPVVRTVKEAGRLPENDWAGRLDQVATAKPFVSVPRTSCSEVIGRGRPALLAPLGGRLGDRLALPQARTRRLGDRLSLAHHAVAPSITPRALDRAWAEREAPLEQPFPLFTRSLIKIIPALSR